FWTASNGGNIVSGSTTLTPIVDKVGTYTLKVTNGTNGCTATSFVNVTADLTPPTLSVQSGEFNCEVTFFTLNATTNAANPTYNWSGPNGFTSTQPSPLTNIEGTYYLTITDTGLNGCTATASATVSANTAPPGASATAGVLTCVVDTVMLNGNSSAPGSSYAWTGPNGFTSNLQNPSATAIGVYTLKVTAANFCTSTATTTVTRNDTPPGASLSVSGNLHCNAATVNLVATSTANPNNLNHVWTLPDSSTVITGKISILAVNQAGTYMIMVTDSINGCSSRDTIEVSRNADVTATATLGQNVSCFGGGNGSATAAGGGGNGNFAYTWSTGANTAQITGLVAGTYTVTVNDGNNCTATAVITITQPSLLAANASATAQSANLVADGTATAAPSGGTAPYTYLWNTGGNTATITGLLPGVYTVTVTDTQGCTAVQAVTVNAYNCSIQSTVNAVNVTCHGASNGSASVSLTGGTAPFTYAWSTGANTPTVSGLPPGQYTVVVTDAANCPSEASFVITQPNTLNANASSSDASGPTASDGSVSAGPTGGTPNYIYLWSTGATSASVSGLLPGTYTVTVSDANGCTSSDETEVSFIDCTISADVAALSPLCHGQSNGSVNISLVGGATPFGYLWSNGATTPNLSGVPAGTYTLTATDANGCTLSAQATLNDPALLSAAIDSTQSPECSNSLNGSISASATGGTGTLTYAWSSGQNTPAISGLGVGNYKLTVSDANNCTATQQVALQAVDNQAPSISQGSPATLSIGLSGTVTVTQQNMNLQVTDNCTVASVNFLPTSFNCDQVGTKTVTVTATDLAGNTSTASFQVNVVDNLAPILSCPASIIRCAGDNVVNYQAPTVSDNCIFGGSFQQTAGLASGATFPQGITLNTYTYTDKAGNVGSCSFEVNILAPIAVTVVQVVNDVNNMNSGSINISVTGGLPPYGFQWQRDGADIPGAINEDLSNIGAGIYTVKITDGNDCSFSGPPIVVLPSGTEEPIWANGFSIRPNPTSGHAEAVFPQVTAADIHLFVYDQTGRQVLSLHRPPQQRLDLDLQALASGTYTVLLRVGNEQVVRKVVVNK
ncbi:MAG TPA: T9SS type A sorting domain-containing protein, partial [Saprospiraceae bacterium]|nr:T9SS type A sorting domain-containing protein [Saprospiraceae bacterium]